MFDNYTVDRATLWAAMADAHVTHAIVEFSGGNDEGGADSIRLDGKEVQIDYKVPLHDLLARLPHERYYSFAGDFEVRGQVRVFANTQTVTIEGSVSTWESFGGDL